ncbi:hypothetical protein JCM10135_12840 [Stetteria hydrogenophila]
MKGIPPLFIEAVARSAGHVSLRCAELGLRCMDPPSATSHLLRRLGYNEYQVRRFWLLLGRAGGGLGVEVYRYAPVSFTLVLRYRKGPVAHLRGGCLPLDSLDCRVLGSRCVKAPHSHALYIYLEGTLEGSGDAMLRVNAVRLLSRLARRSRRAVESLVDAVVDAAWGRAGASSLYEAVLEALRLGRGLLRHVLPLLPGTVEELALFSPALRRLAATTEPPGTG